MYIRPLKYNKPVEQQLLDILNFTNGTAIEPWQVTFGPPIPEQDREIPINLPHVHDYDLQRPNVTTLTRIEVKPTPESGWRRSQHLTYRRRIIQDHFAAVPFVIYAVENSDAVILKALKDQYGLHLEPHLVTIDFEQIDITTVLFQTHMGSIIENDIECDDYIPPVTWNANVKINPEHPIWMGEIKVYIREAVQLLDRPIKTTLEVKRYLGPGNHDKLPAEMILPMDRFVDYDHTLKHLKHGDLVGAWAVDMAKRVTGDEWVFEKRPLPFNLYGAKVVYNGLNTGEIYINDPKVSNALIIQFHDEYSNNLAGQWIIGYYNHENWLRRSRIDHLPIQDQ